MEAHDLLEAMAPEPGGYVEITFFDPKGKQTNANDARVVMELYANIREAKKLVQLYNPLRDKWSLVNKDTGRIVCTVNRPIKGIPIIKPKGEADAANT